MIDLIISRSVDCSLIVSINFFFRTVIVSVDYVCCHFLIKENLREMGLRYPYVKGVRYKYKKMFWNRDTGVARRLARQVACQQVA